MEKQEEKQKSRLSKRARVRLIPIWLRLIIVVSLAVVSTVLGAVIGYSVIGDGKPLDALKPSTWQHIVDIVEKDMSDQ